MRARIDIRIDPECHLSGFAQPVCNCGKLVKLGKAFDIELPDTGFEPGCHFIIGFADLKTQFFPAQSLPPSRAAIRPVRRYPRPRRGAPASQSRQYLNWL